MPLQATSGAASYDAFGGGVPVVANYIEDVFSTWLYTGNGSTQTITNGIDLSTKGGLVWIKSRNTATDNVLYTTNIGTSGFLYANGTSGLELTPEFTSFNANGFSVSNDSLYAEINVSSTTYASWSFRKQPKFFDVVTYTGTGSNTTIAHNLGSVPGCIMVKRRNATSAWAVYHRSLANTEYLVLNTTAAKATGATRWNSTTPTSTVFSLGTDATVNASGGTYVAYIFAHDAGGFGRTGTDNVISCGSYTGNAGTQSITLGYEPQWIMVKKSSGVGSWHMFDIMRGMPVPIAAGNNQDLLANTSDAETGGFRFFPTATGFGLLTETDGEVNASGQTYIYIAIRRGPMKVPTSGTSVFSPNAYTTNASTPTTVTTNFPVDLNLYKFRTQTYGTYASDRLRGTTTASSNFMITSSTNAEGAGSQGWGIDSNTGYVDAWAYQFIGTAENVVSWNFRRAPSFFDEVCYTGTGSATTFSHNLGVVPELMIVKRRSGGTGGWVVYSSTLGATNYLILSSVNASAANSTFWNDTAPTSSVFTVATDNAVNGSGSTYVAYLFSTCVGVSKVGSYTGNGSTQTIDCGLTAGARFVLIKRTDQTGNWYVYDTARGMTVLTDPYLLLNSTAAETATLGSVTTVSTGFAVNSTILSAINVSSGTYIFLAIA